MSYYEEYSQILERLEVRTQFKVIDRGSLVEYRARKTDKDEYFVFPKGNKNRGWKYNKYRLMQNYELKDGENILSKSEADKQEWEKNVKKVIKKLEKSGLWPDVLAMYKTLDEMGYEKRKVLIEYDSYVHRFDNQERGYCGPKQLENEALKIREEFPMCFDKDQRVNWDYIFEISQAKLKSMYFGKYSNKTEKEEIKNALKTKSPYRCFHIAGYDVRYSYEPERNKAWYSEEYRNCGNGHYYIALDENTALFVEDD